jgi:hypothetical protein
MTTAIKPQPTALKFWKAFVRLQNPLMKWLLRSPFHALVSNSYMLLSVTGRKTGKVYTTPVQYYQQDKVLKVITSRDYVWWRNLIGGAEVRMRLRGNVESGYTSISTNPDVIITVLSKMYPKMSHTQCEQLGDNSVAIYITLDE